MRPDVERQFLHHMPSGTLRTGQDLWRFYVLGASRIDRDWFIHIAVVGTRTHLLDVRSRADHGHAVVARRVVSAVADWLLAGDCADHAFLELAGVVDHAC